MTILFLASVNLVSLSTQLTDAPSSSRWSLGDSGVRLISPWKCGLESWLRDHRSRWAKNVLLCCSDTQAGLKVLRGDLITDGGDELHGEARSRAVVSSTADLMGVVGWPKSRLLGRVIIYVGVTCRIRCLLRRLRLFCGRQRGDRVTDVTGQPRKSVERQWNNKSYPAHADIE